MKQTLLLLVLLLVVFLPLPAGAGLTGSKHDLTRDAKETYSRDEGAVCRFCHTPHGGTSAGSAAKWVRQSKEAGEAFSFALHEWTLAVGGESVTPPDAGTLNCLSCHDGTIAPNIFLDQVIQQSAGSGTLDKQTAKNHASAFAGHDRGSYHLSTGRTPGQAITGDHPVGIIYARGRAGLADRETVEKSGVTLSGRSGNQVGCASCHNPHTTEHPFYLAKSLNELCSSCHTGRSSGRHVLVGFGVGDDHPVTGKSDPLRPGKKMSCTSCHNPHTSKSSVPVPGGKLTPENLCTACHRK